MWRQLLGHQGHQQGRGQRVGVDGGQPSSSHTPAVGINCISWRLRLRASRQPCCRPAGASSQSRQRTLCSRPDIGTPQTSTNNSPAAPTTAARKPPETQQRPARAGSSPSAPGLPLGKCQQQQQAVGWASISKPAAVSNTAASKPAAVPQQASSSPAATQQQCRSKAAAHALTRQRRSLCSSPAIGSRAARPQQQQQPSSGKPAAAAPHSSTTAHTSPSAPGLP